MVPSVQVLDSLGGRSSLMRDVTMETGLSEVVLPIVLAIWLMRSSTQPAESRASASWSQHSSMVSHIWVRPCSHTPRTYRGSVPLHFKEYHILEVQECVNSSLLYFNWEENKDGTHPGNAVKILPQLLTGCFSQQSLMAGRIFLCTTTSWRSSREGC